ncbi:acyl-CoA dehydrogenase family protein [Streptomyces sp. NPDC087294]|uniref:acyl-CoA dehydrogenase family protein n=1 Tax=Streptomyces sp. NPDC087294 TaxID=3365777 RepID=UPI0038005988
MRDGEAVGHGHRILGCGPGSPPPWRVRLPGPVRRRERIVRDLRVPQILEGTNEIMRVIVARGLTEAFG